MCRVVPQSRHLLGRDRPNVRIVTLLLSAAGVSVYCAAAPQAPQFWGFTGPWDVRSDSSVIAHGTKLDAVISGWITIDSASGQPILPSQYADTLHASTATSRRMALVTSWHGDRFHIASIRTLGRNAEARNRAAGALARYAANGGYDGLVFDFEMLERSDLDVHRRVLRAMADSARARGIGIIAVAVPARDTAAYPAGPLLAIADALVVMLYDQHWPGSEPGPISDPVWLRESLRLRLAGVDPARIVAGLPLYGYRWRPGQPADPVSFAEARLHAASARVPLQRDSASRTLRSVESDGTETWVTDAELLRVLIAASRAAGVHRFALWRLGQEDPAVWSRVIGQSRAP